MYLMNRFLKTLWFTATLLLCLVCSSGLLAHAAEEETKIVTGKVSLKQFYSKANLEYNGALFEVADMKGLKNPIVCNLYSPKITKKGLKLLGVDNTTSNTMKPLNFSLTNALVLDSTIYATYFFPNESNLSLLQTTAKMEGSTVVFNFQELQPQDGVVVYIVDTNAVWSSGPGGDVLSIVGGKSTIQLFERCGFYVLRTNATRARSIIAQAGTYTHPEMYGIDMHNGLLAVDYATCKDCTGAFFEGGLHSIANSHKGFFRFQNCTHNSPNGDQPFFRFNAHHHDGFLVYGNAGNIILSGIATNGPLFELHGENKLGKATCRKESQLVMQHISASASGFPSDKFFSWSDMECDVYLGNLTFGGVNYTANLAEAVRVMNYSKVIDDYGLILHRRESDISKYDEGRVGDYSTAYCTRNETFDGVYRELMPPQEIVDEYAANGVTLKRWKRNRCKCKKGTFEPYCTTVYDPLLFPQGYTFEKPKCETDPETCEECAWGNWDVCTKCKPFYEFDDKGNCVRMKCLVDNCALCEDNSTTLCKTCTVNYVLTPEKTCVKPTNSTGDVETPTDEKGLSTGAIVGIAVGCAAFVLLLLLLILILCCCRSSNEMHVVYQQGYNDDEEEEYADRELRPFHGGSGVFSRVVVVQDYVKPRIFKKDDTSIYGSQSSFADDSSDSSGSSEFSDSSEATSSEDSEY